MIPEASEVFDLLREASVALTLALAVVLLVRAPLRHRCGAATAYAAWLTVPAALFALALPAPVVEFVPETSFVAAPVALVEAIEAAPTIDRTPIWLALWALGALSMAAYQWRLQRRFVASLGPLSRVAPGVWRARARSGLPALVGAWRARIVVPADFELRYDADERALMLAHERAHLHRGDPWANLAATMLRIAFWFHPLAHAAASRFRTDQELACDRRVIASAPHARRAYGEAMLKTLVAAQPVPLGCHWGLTHPLKERLMQLHTPPPRRFARAAGIVVACVAIAGTAFAVWSAQTPTRIPAVSTAHAAPRAADVPRGDYVADIRVRMDDGRAETFAIGAAYGEPIAFYQQTDAGRVDVEARIRDAGRARYDVVAKIERDGRVVAQPHLIVESGKPAAVRVGEQADDGAFEGISLDMVVKPSSSSGADAPVAQRDTALPSWLASSSPPPAPPAPPAAPAPPAPPAAPSVIAPLAPLAPLSPMESIAPPAPPSPPTLPDLPAPPESPDGMTLPAQSQALAAKQQAEARGQQALAAKQQAEARGQQALAAKQQAEARGQQALAAKQQAEARGQQALAAKQQAEARGQHALAAKQLAEAQSQQAAAAKAQAEARTRQSREAEKETDAAPKPVWNSRTSRTLLPMRNLRLLSAQSSEQC